MQHKHEFRDVAQELTNRIIDVIEATSKLPYKREWDPSKCAGPQAPINAFTGEPYHGSNALFLAWMPEPSSLVIRAGQPSSKRQMNTAMVKKGAKSVLGIFYKPLEIEDEKTEDGKRVVPILKTFHAFHASEIEGLPHYDPPTIEEAPWTRPDAVTTIMKNSGITYRTGGDRAFYAPAFDLVQMSPEVAFPAPQYWSSVVIHETNHGTGHPTRMNRDLKGKFGSDAYACEEARVEIATVFVCDALALPTDFQNSAIYIGAWLKKLKEDKREVLHAAADAEKIAAYTLAWHPDFAAKHEPSKPNAQSQHAEAQAVP